MKKTYSRWRLLAGLLIIVFLFLYGVSPRADAETIPSERAKFGIALGGGGAAGFFHLGVLRWLEDNRIPVDYVAGTSMGGLIGGCYAMGMSPAEIEGLLYGLDWDQIFINQPPYSALSFRRKEDRRSYPIDLEIGLKGGFALPSGLSIHQVGVVLSRVALPYSFLNNFDELPIPFRCVATDIRQSELVVFRNGSLVEAMRASMAFPGAFTPVENNGRLMVDGGVLNNVPADIVKQMGANCVLAVDVFPSSGATISKGIDTVLMDTINTVVVNNTKQQLKDADLVISPEGKGLVLIQWKAIKEYDEMGYQAAAQKAQFLRKYAVDEETWSTYVKNRETRRRVTVPVPMDIEVIGANELGQRYIKKKLKHLCGKPLNTNVLERDLTEIMGVGLFESLRYELTTYDGIPYLVIKAIEKSYGPPFVNFALLMDLNGIDADDVDINPRFRVTSFNVAGPWSELRTDIGFGSEPQLQCELYQPFGISNLFWAPSLYLKHENNSLYSDGFRVTDYSTAIYGAAVDIGVELSKFAEARIGYGVENRDFWVKVGNPIDPSWDGIVQKTYLELNYYNADNGILPRRRLDWSLNATRYFSVPNNSQPFGKLESQLTCNVPVGAQDSVMFLFSGGTSSEALPINYQFRLGGPSRLGAYRLGEFTGSHYIYGSIGYEKSMGNIPFMGPGYLSVWLEQGGIADDWLNLYWKRDLSFGFKSPTVLGLLFLGVSFGDSESRILNLSLGRSF